MKGPIRIDPPEWHRAGGELEYAARVHGLGERRRLWFRLPAELEGSLTNSADPFLAALLPTASALGRPLLVEGGVSRRLLDQIGQILEIWNWRDPRLRKVQVEARAVKEERCDARRGCASFFSGGVDSFYTLLKNLDLEQDPDRVTHLLCVQGFDLDPDNDATYALVAERMESVAAALGLRLIRIRTNMRALTDRHAHWQWRQMGAGMCAVGLHLAPLFRRILIPAGEGYLPSVLLAPSNALLDPLFGTDAIEFVHDGCEATRLQKVRRYVARSDLALRHLRVCYRNAPRRAPQHYNCGECPKCVRTMVGLHIAGVLDRCETFDGAALDPEVVRRCACEGGHPATYAEENLIALERTGAEPELQAALRAGLRRARRPLKRLEHFWKAHPLRALRRLWYRSP